VYTSTTKIIVATLALVGLCTAAASQSTTATVKGRVQVGPPVQVATVPKTLLSGTGTPGAVPRWLGPHALGDSALVQSSLPGTVGNIGIGTTAPDADLHIEGNGSLELSGSVFTTGGMEVLGDGATLFEDELAVGDAIVIEGNLRTVVAITSQFSLTVDAALPIVSGVSAFTDSDLFRVRSAAGSERLVLDAQGGLHISGLRGVTDGSEAPPGMVGEVIEATAQNVQLGMSDTTIGTISLPPGDWDIRVSADVASDNYWFTMQLKAAGDNSVSGDTELHYPIRDNCDCSAGLMMTRKNLSSQRTYSLVVRTHPNGLGNVDYFIRARRAR
jgi:hypothetical protein